MSSSNCCFLTYIQISQEAGKEVSYSPLFKNCKFVVIHTVKDFSQWSRSRCFSGIFLLFFYDPTDAGNLISGSFAFSKSSLNIWKFLVHTVEACFGEYEAWLMYIKYLFFGKCLFILFWLRQTLAVAHGVFVAACSSHCGTGASFWLCYMGSSVAVCGPSCTMALGSLVSPPEKELASPALEAGFSTTGPPGKSLHWVS